MNERLVAIFLILFTLVLMILTIAKKNVTPVPENQFEWLDVEPKLEPELPKPEEKFIPEFENHPAIRNVTNLGKVLSDIEEHMPEGHIYKDEDKITWGHETTHGINSNLRMKFSTKTTSLGDVQLLGTWIDDIHGHKVFKSYARINGFYVLEDRAVIINEPDTTVGTVAELVPRSLRGGVYKLYMIDQAKSWNDTPLYIFDEWTAYTNGSEVRLDLGIKERSETVLYMLEFNVYALCLAQACKTEDMQFKNYLKWNIERSMKLYLDSKEKLGNAERHDAYLETMKTSTDAEVFRTSARDYLGIDWTKKVLGF